MSAHAVRKSNEPQHALRLEPITARGYRRVDVVSAVFSRRNRAALL
jgi:hypothetical protein